MRWLLVLGAAVALVVGVWLVTQSSLTSGNSGSTVEIRVPGPLEDMQVLIKSSQQLLNHTPAPGRTRGAIALLAALTDRLTAQEWPLVQVAAFRGWCLLRPIPESKEGLEPLADRLMSLFARFGSAADLETMIGWAKEDTTWGSRVNLVLQQMASAEVPRSGYPNSRLALLLEGSVRARDYDRAGDYVSRARFEEGTPEGIIVPFKRLESALRHYFATKRGTAVFPRIIQEWSQAQSDRWVSQVLLEGGFQMVRAGQFTLDFSRLHGAIQETASVPDAEKYWAAALKAFVRYLPLRGRFAERPALEALVGAYATTFNASAFECEFWTKLADDSKVDAVDEGLWRAECLKRAAKAASPDEMRVKLSSRVADESLKYGSPEIAWRNVDYGTQGLKEEAAKAELAKILARIDARATANRDLMAKAQKGLHNPAARSQLRVLKTALAQAKSRKDPADVISGLEKEIRELEKALPE